MAPPLLGYPIQATGMADLPSPPASQAYCKDEVKYEMRRQLDRTKRGHQMSWQDLKAESELWLPAPALSVARHTALGKSQLHWAFGLLVADRKRPALPCPA